MSELSLLNLTLLKRNNPLLMENLSKFLRLASGGGERRIPCWNITLWPCLSAYYGPDCKYLILSIYFSLYELYWSLSTRHTSVLLIDYLDTVIMDVWTYDALYERICIPKTSTHMIFGFVNKFDVITNQSL